MRQALWTSGKRSAGWLLARDPKYRYSNCIFILAHMRCGSTALSNILCSRPEISGYGEAHNRYDGQGALGRLALNQMRHGGWKPDATYLFDKILHSRHDRAAPAAFTSAKAIFMARRPAPAIRSICNLFAKLERDQYRTHEQAAAYYVQRLDALFAMWARFPRDGRVGLTHTSLIQDPEHALAQISGHFAFDPPLENRYVSLKASRKGGGGDPLSSGKHTRIETSLPSSAEEDETLDIDPALSQAASDRYQRFRDLIAEDWPELAAH